MWRKLFIGIVALLVVLILFAFWYRSTYSMKKVDIVEMNVGGQAAEVLIATQGSAYKDAVVAQVANGLVERDAHVRIVDVSALKGVDPTAWDAVLVLHTWEYWKPQPDAAAFREQHTGVKNVIYLSTSGSGEERLDPVDGISSASITDDVARDAQQVLERLFPLLSSN